MTLIRKTIVYLPIFSKNPQNPHRKGKTYSGLSKILPKDIRLKKSGNQKGASKFSKRKRAKITFSKPCKEGSARLQL